MKLKALPQREELEINLDSSVHPCYDEVRVGD